MRAGEAGDMTGENAKASLFGFPHHLEDEARYLCQLLFQGTDVWLARYENPIERLRTDLSFARDYRCAVHRGFFLCQEHVVQRLQMPGVRSPPEIALYRDAIDCIAWQLFGHQMHIARRFYQGQKPPSLAESNFSSVHRIAVENFSAPDHSRFPLLTDLTSFVQVGDILVADVNLGTLTIVEVKEGEKNHRVLEFARALAEHPCARAAHFFREEEGEKAFQQLGRTLRQASRMEHVSRFVNTGESYDPDQKALIKTIESQAQPETYDGDLAELLERSTERNWAISVIDECLFLGVYRENFRLVGESIFRAWFEGSGGESGFPLENLLATSTFAPLGLPVLAKFLPREAKLDLMFARAVAYVAIDMNAFIALGRANGLNMRWSTPREAARMKRGTNRPWTHVKRAVIVERGGEKGSLSDGLLMRMIHHGVTPKFAVQILKDYTQTADGVDSPIDTGADK